jgi:hypothetical protein
MPLIKSSHGYNLIISVFASSCVTIGVTDYARTRLLQRQRHAVSLAYLMLGKIEQRGRLRARLEFTHVTSS